MAPTIFGIRLGLPRQALTLRPGVYYGQVEDMSDPDLPAEGRLSWERSQMRLTLEAGGGFSMLRLSALPPALEAVTPSLRAGRWSQEGHHLRLIFDSGLELRGDLIRPAPDGFIMDFPAHTGNEYRWRALP